MRRIEDKLPDTSVANLVIATKFVSLRIQTVSVLLLCQSSVVFWPKYLLPHCRPSYQRNHHHHRWIVTKKGKELLNILLNIDSKRLGKTRKNAFPIRVTRLHDNNYNGAFTDTRRATCGNAIKIIM